ncbi:MAG: hypothetical protein IKG42_01775 [Clostridia bacterium]|nr:hypothetical protein [Clostridia bacterium]
MENVSKALILAGSILIGVMTISIIMYIYRKGGDTALSMDEKILRQEIVSYNNPFTSLAAVSENYDNGEGDLRKGEISIYNVISIINYSKNINDSLEYDSEVHDQTQNEDYIIIDVKFNNDRNINEDVTVKSQSELHTWIKNYSDSNFQFQINKYNSSGKINKVTFIER